MRAPPRISLMQVLQARQRRIGSPRRSFSTHCGSAISVRPSAMKSALPSSTAAVAVAGSPSRPTAITGTSHHLLHRGREVEERRVRHVHRRDHDLRRRQRAVVPGGDVQRVGAGLGRPDRDPPAFAPTAARPGRSPRPRAGRSPPSPAPPPSPRAAPRARSARGSPGCRRIRRCGGSRTARGIARSGSRARRGSRRSRSRPAARAPPRRHARRWSASMRALLISSGTMVSIVVS